MTEPESSHAALSRSRLPSPGCLLAVTLLVIVVSVCFWIGWRGHRQQARLAYFEQIGARVETEPGRPVWLHDLAVARLGEEDAARFTVVTYVDLRGTQVTDADLQHLRGLTNLQELWLRNTQVTDAGLQHLSGLSDLEELSLSNTQVTDAGLEHLSGLTNLRKLYLRNTQVTDAGLQHLSGLTNLNWLFLENTQVTDAGLQHLKGLTRLKWLDLENTQVTEAGADELVPQLPEARIIR